MTVKILLRKSSSGRIGSAARRSTSTKRPSRITEATTIAAISGEPQGYVVPPRLVNSTIAERPAASSDAPSQSIACLTFSVREWNAVWITTSATIPIGRLM